MVRKFAHAHIAILASSYSDDVIAIEVKKNRNILIRFLEFPSVKFLQIWQVIPYYFQIETHNFKFTKHVSDDQQPSSVANTSEPLVGVI